MKRHEALIDQEANARNIAEARKMRQDIRTWREESLKQVGRLEEEQAAGQYQSIMSWLKMDESDQLAIFDSISAEGTSDVIGLDWSWIRDSIQSNPELGRFLIWSSDCLSRFSSGAKRLIQLERSNPIQNGLQSNNITGRN